MSFTWYNEPKQWSASDLKISVHTDANTDFWRKTHHDFERDNGHFYYRSFPGDQNVVATVKVRGKYTTLYDQGGLMIRIDEKNWIKCGVEYVDGNQFASVVVTINGWSDWSVVPIQSPDVLKIRLKRDKETIFVEYAAGENDDLKMMRIAHFPVDKSKAVMVGIMCASPNEETQGFDIDFDGLSIIETQEQH